MIFPSDSSGMTEKDKDNSSDQQAGTSRPVVLITNDFLTYDENKMNMIQDSTSPRPLLEELHHTQSWTGERKATDFFVSMLTSLYLLVITIFGFIIEVSPQWGTQIWLGETMFFFFMYGLGLLYFAYFYVFMIYTMPYNYCVRVLHKFKVINDVNDWLLEPVSHTGEGAGTLYLRLGAMLFGGAAVILFGLELFLCVESYSCYGTVVAKHIVAIIFTFVQMQFIFCNTQITILRGRNVSKLGMMHLVAVNLWTWFRFVVAKQVAKANKKKYSYPDSSSSSSSSEEDSVRLDHGLVSGVVNETIETVYNEVLRVVNLTSTPKTPNVSAGRVIKLVSLEYFGGFTTFLTTCIVEYSLIGAAVMFIIWRSINHPHVSHHTMTVKRKYKMSIDCSNSSWGLFAGVLFLIATIVSMGMYTVFEELRDSDGASSLFGTVDLVLFATALAASLFGLWRMRHLQYRLHAHGEVIDEILLVIGLLGELIYCTIAIDMFIATHREKNKESILPIFVFVTRFVQVVVQTAFIVTASRLRCLSSYAMKYKPGRQVITFLLISNITLFAFHTFEATKSSFGINCDVSKTYMTIIYAVGPLLVFFRFHSSACLAEIWKITYSTKDGESRHRTMSSMTPSESSRTLSTSTSTVEVGAMLTANHH